MYAPRPGRHVVLRNDRPADGDGFKTAPGAGKAKQRLPRKKELGRAKERQL